MRPVTHGMAAYRRPSRSGAPRAAWLIAFAVLLAGCATTRIASEDPAAKIYMDGRYLGTGKARVNTVGPPHSADLEARKGGEVVGTATMRRSFRWQTILFGICSYYTGLYWGWFYPDEVRIPLAIGRLAPRDSTGRDSFLDSPWNKPPPSVWTRPLRGD